MTLVMCGSPDCPARERCTRHEASGTRPAVWQEYGDFRALPSMLSCAAFLPRSDAPERLRWQA